MNDAFEQLKKDVATVRMTDAERARISNFLRASLVQPVARGVGTRTWFMRHAFATGSLAVLLVLGGVSVSANSAHPDDVLYRFRVQVNDRIEEALARDDDAWFDVQLRQMERQLDDEEEVSAGFEEDESGEELEDDGKEEGAGGISEQVSADDDDEEEGGRELAEDSRGADRDIEEAERIERDLGDEERSSEEALISL